MYRQLQAPVVQRDVSCRIWRLTVTPDFLIRTHRCEDFEQEAFEVFIFLTVMV
jgi:hypothetical protein